MSRKSIWYDKVAVTPPDHVKKVKYGDREFHTVRAAYQRDLATEIWGDYGVAWGLFDLKFDVIRDEIRRPIIHTLDAVFKHPVFKPGTSEFIADSSFPISVDMAVYDSKGRIIDDSRKKLITEATTKALSFLGFSLDVFMGQYDDQKYVENIPSSGRVVKPDASDKVVNSLIAAIDKASSPERLKRIMEGLSNFKFTDAQVEKITEFANKKTFE